MPPRGIYSNVTLPYLMIAGQPKILLDGMDGRSDTIIHDQSVVEL